MPSIKDMNIFILKRFVGNIDCKLSTVTDYSAKHQILCVVSDTNELLFHYTNIKRYDILKVVTWFQKSLKNIVDVCFDPTGLWLLVLCVDNTIHIVPAFKFFGKHSDPANTTFSTNFITSYEIPLLPKSINEDENAECTKHNINDKSCSETGPNSLETELKVDSISVNELPIDTAQAQPSSITWWNTKDNRNRAVIGYSDGTLCFFGLDFPFTATASTGNASIDKLLIYKDNRDINILLVTLRNKEQYKVILEQCYSDYLFSNTTIPKTTCQSNQDNKAARIIDSLIDENVIEKTSSDNNSIDFNQPAKHFTEAENYDENITKNSLRSSTKSRLASLKLLGSKKSNTLKTKTTEQKDNECEDNPAKYFDSIELPLTPELINNNNGAIYVTQYIRNISFLSVLDSNSNTLSVHHIDENLSTLFRYKVPNDSSEILITSNILYSIQNSKNSEDNLMSTVTILSSALASIKDNSDILDHQHEVLSSFNFYNENLINIHRKANFFEMDKDKVESSNFKQTSTKSTDEYYFYDGNNTEKNTECLPNEKFQKIIFDPCYVVTNKNIYYIDLRKDPLDLIIDAALAGLWIQCEQFCNTFNIPLSRCLEFVGDHFLREKKVNQALLSFNVVKIPPVRTALKLAINRENYPLMHLCAMALKHVYITKSKYYNSPILKTLLKNIQYLHVEDVLKILPRRINQNKIVNDGQHCSDHKYCPDDSVTSLQMTMSSQFHLSNLMLITLAEKAVRDKNYIPLWNFLICNGKYHTHMTSIVLTQSGLHSSALVLAMTRGCFIEVFIALASVLNQEFGCYSEINVCLYNLSDSIFLECLLYLQNVSEQYFSTVQNKISLITMSVLKRLEKQFSPFAPVFRPMFDKYYLATSEENVSNEKSYNFISFFSTLIETYLAIIIHIHAKNSVDCNILNAFSTFKLDYEEPKKLELLKNYIPLSVGYTHCTCVIDGVVYFWGSNGVPTVFSIENIQDTNEPFHTVKRLDLLKELNLEVFAVKCGRQHTVILTNNGIFTFGSNQLYQLGIGKNILAAQHPMLVKGLDCKNITLFDAGQYHNAVVADNNLYTWGWGLYGQLGHGDIENVPVPTVVEFFSTKKIIDISLGHAHSLVLCINNTFTELYVFGSNHFGQLGIGILGPEKQCNNKILTPVLLNIGNNIVLVQTKFFSNLAVTDSEQLYTWGSSPQALRLENQNKKRASSKQKIAATITKEIRRRTGVTSDQCNSNDSNTCETKTIDSNEKQNNSGNCNTANLTNNIDETSNREKKKNCSENIKQTEFTTEQYSKETTSEQQHHVEPPNMDHMSPRLVDTNKISGSISYISTGLFHFAIICSNNCLYTWGRNFDHQLGNQDKERKYIYEPAKVECIDYVLYVDCGADFTIVMTKENVVKAFGGNANGQCGQDIKQSAYNSFNQNRLLCLPITKRFMRFETHSVVCPHNIDLPSPKANLQYDSIKYFKNLPKYSPDMVTKIYETLCEEKNNLLSLNTKVSLIPISDETSDTELPSSFKNQTRDTCSSLSNYSSDYIHYCLYIFHKLYNPDKIMNIAKNNLEYQIRILLLNLDFVQAFRVCLMNCHTAVDATRIFQYFTKNSNIVPIKIENFKIYIYGLLSHFVARNYDMNDCESFFLSDLDYYLVEISFVLYLNRGSSKLTTVLRRKFEDIFQIQNTEISFDGIDLIFEKLSIKFKTIICQNILKSLKV